MSTLVFIGLNLFTAALLAVDLTTTSSIGSLAWAPALAGAWFLGGRWAAALVILAVGARAVAVGLGDVSLVVGAAQSLSIVAIGYLGHLAALGARGQSEKIRAEREIRELTGLLRVAEDVAAAVDVATILDGSVRGASALVSDAGRPARAAFHRLDGEELEVAVELPTGGLSFSGGRYHLDDHRGAARALTERSLQVVTMEDLGPEILAIARRDGWRSGVMAPVLAGESVYGLLVVTSRTEDSLNEGQTRLVEIVARLAGLAIGHVEHLRREHEHALRMESLEQTKTEFLRLASHELRGPLTVIKGYVSMVSEGVAGAVPASMRPMLEEISAKSNEMDSLVNQMLDAARLEDSSLLLRIEKVDLRAIVQTAGAMRTPAHRFEIEVPDAPVTVSGDRERLQMIVGNLVSNAVKYSPDGGDVRIVLKRNGTMAVVEVIDRGIGIPTAARARLFTRFGRIVSRRHAGISGTGLGLYLSRELAHLHGGELKLVESTTRGSRFRLTIPLEGGPR